MPEGWTDLAVEGVGAMRPPRRWREGVAAATLLVVLWSWLGGPQPALAKRHPPGAGPQELIVLVLIDAMRPDHMGSYGYTRPTTPVLDAFAKEGRRFTRAYVNAPWTRPSTASFFTGLHASRHRTQTYKTKLPDDVTTIAQRLRKAGYTTAGFCANGNGGSLAGLERGFDVYEDPTNTYTREVRGKTYNGLPTGPFIVRKALSWLARTDAQKVFLFLFLVDPHDPYRAPPRLEKEFLGDFKGTVRRKALWEHSNDYPDDERWSMIAVYDAAIRFADQAMGMFFSGLKARGLYDRASIFVSADHGEGFGEHGFYLHAHHFWDEVVRVPLLFRSPRVEPGVDSRLTQSLDVAATIVDLAGASAKGLPGRSLLATPATAATVVSEYNEFGIHRQAIVGERYKVILQLPADEAWYLREARDKKYFPSVSFDDEVVRVFDLQKDPKEQQDLAKGGIGKAPAAAQVLLQQLRDFVAAAPATQSAVMSGGPEG